jgi:hypothetical protein
MGLVILELVVVLGPGVIAGLLWLNCRLGVVPLDIPPHIQPALLGGAVLLGVMFVLVRVLGKMDEGEGPHAYIPWVFAAIGAALLLLVYRLLGVDAEIGWGLWGPTLTLTPENEQMLYERLVEFQGLIVFLYIVMVIVLVCVTIHEAHTSD